MRLRVKRSPGSEADDEGNAEGDDGVDNEGDNDGDEEGGDGDDEANELRLLLSNFYGRTPRKTICLKTEQKKT